VVGYGPQDTDGAPVLPCYYSPGLPIPEELTNQLHTDTHELERRVREKVAVELYQEGASEEQIRRLLNLDTRFEVHALLKRHGVPLRYTLQDLEDDRDTLRRLGL